MKSIKKIIDADDFKKQVDISVIANKLNVLLDERNISTKVLSETTGISIAAINNLKRGEGNPTLGTLNLISNFFSISLVELLCLSEVGAASTQTTVINLYDLRNVDNRIDENIINKMLIEMPKNVDIKNIYGVVVGNNSLAPMYEKGVIFVLSCNQKVADGDMVLARIQNNINQFKRIFFRKDSVYLKNITIDDSMEVYDKKDVNTLGVVIQITQKIF